MRSRSALVAAFVCGLVLTCAPAALAETITVTTTADTTDPADDQTSLREAVEKPLVAGEDRVVVVPAGTYALNPNAPLLLDEGAGDSITIRGAGARATIIDGQDATRLVIVATATTATITDLTLTHALASGEDSAGLSNHGTTRLERVAVLESFTDEAGGGIGNAATGDLTIVHSTISRNIADGGGAGTTRAGAGIANAGTLRIQLSTIAGNDAISGVGGGFEGRGGGLYQAATGTTRLEGVTIAHNRATGPNGDGGNVHIVSGGTVETFDSLLVGGRPDNCNADLNRLPSGDSTLADDASCAVTSTAAAFAPLYDNGGPTDTVALRAGSPALDKAESCAGDERDALAMPATDQRGEPRPSGAGCDLGAYELQVAPPDDGGDGDGNGDGDGGGGGTPPPAPISPPVLPGTGPGASTPQLAPVAALRMRPTRFRARRGRGALVSYRLAAPGRVRITVERLSPGRRVGKRCVRPRRSNRARAGCTRRTRVKGSILRVSEAGTSSFRFRGVIGGRTLRAGRYALVTTVVRGSRRSVARRIGFTILRARR